MKKLTKKSLDELAQEMPTVNEIQQRECVGGVCYLGTSGQSLFDDNSVWQSSMQHDQIYVLTDSQYQNFVSSGSHPSWDKGKDIREVSNQEVINIFMGFNSAMYSIIPTGIINDSIVVNDSSSQSGIYVNANNQLVFNRSNLSTKSGLSGAWSNFYVDPAWSGVVD